MDHQQDHTNNTRSRPRGRNGVARGRRDQCEDENNWLSRAIDTEYKMPWLFYGVPVTLVIALAYVATVYDTSAVIFWLGFTVAVAIYAYDITRLVYPTQQLHNASVLLVTIISSSWLIYSNPVLFLRVVFITKITISVVFWFVRLFE